MILLLGLKRSPIPTMETTDPKFHLFTSRTYLFAAGMFSCGSEGIYSIIALLRNISCKHGYTNIPLSTKSINISFSCCRYVLQNIYPYKYKIYNVFARLYLRASLHLAKRQGQTSALTKSKQHQRKCSSVMISTITTTA